MRHWDLFPGEHVVLRSDHKRLRGQFLFRDTKIAAFRMETGEYREFKLRQSGSLRDSAEIAEILGAHAHRCFAVTATEVAEAIASSQVWTIEGPDRHTRGTAISFRQMAGGS